MTRLNIPIIFLFACVAYAQPYQPNVVWDRSGESDSASYGTQVLPLGDQNSDGFADWAVMAWGNKGYGGVQTAYLEFFHSAETLMYIPYMTYYIDSTVYGPSWSVLAIGDVSGDGYQDWLVWAYPLTHPTTYDLPTFFGGPQADSIPDAYVPTTYQSSVHAIGDFNADGFSDIVTYNEGTHVAKVYFGGSPMDTIPDWTIWQPPPGIDQTIPYATGDFNGDGASDFICFNPNPPYNLAIFLGGANPDTVPAYAWSNAGWPNGGVKSLNGDNADEFLLGLGVHYGRDSLRVAPDAVLNFSCPAEGGLYIASAGDFNHDQYSDLLMWTPSCVNNSFGFLTLHLGHPWLNPEPAFVIDGWTDPVNLIGIWTAAGLGDVNGDSIDDIAIGAWDDLAYLGWRGRCIIVAGDDSLIAAANDARPEIPSRLSVQAYPNPFNSETTIQIEIPLSSKPVTLTVFDVLGREVQHEILPPLVGDYSYRFSAQGLPSGLYLAHVQSGNLQTIHKLMVLK